MYAFDKITYDEIKEKPSYIISDIILKQKSKFTIEDIWNNVFKELQNLNRNDEWEEKMKLYTIEKIRNLRDNDRVVEHGSYYSVSK